MWSCLSSRLYTLSQHVQRQLVHDAAIVEAFTPLERRHIVILVQRVVIAALEGLSQRRPHRQVGPVSEEQLRKLRMPVTPAPEAHDAVEERRVTAEPVRIDTRAEVDVGA